MPSKTSARDIEYARLRWQCRRGMRELDLLLQDFLERRYATLPDGAKKAFATLLSYSDPVLLEYLMGRMTPRDGDVADVVAQIRRTAES